MSFITVDVVTDPTTLLDTGVDSMNAKLAAAGYPGWSAGDATGIVLLLATVSEIAASLGNQAAVVFPAIWRVFGTQFLGLTYQMGLPATVLSVWSFTSPAPTGGYTVLQGTTVTIDGVAFYTQSDTVTDTGATSATIMLVAAQSGTAGDGLGGVGVGAPRVELQDGIDWVAAGGVTVEGVTSGGADQESDTDFQDRCVAAVALQAPRPLVAPDFASLLLTDIAASATGVVTGRATSIDGYFPDGRALSTGGSSSPTVLACTLTTGSPTVQYTAVGGQVPAVGAAVSGTGVPGGATVAPSPAPTDVTFTLSALATATGAESLTVAAMSGYGPAHLTCTATFSNAATAVAIVAGPAGCYGAIPEIGARVTGPGVPLGASVAASPAPTAAGFYLSANSSSAETGVTLTVSSWTNVPLANTSFVTDVLGDALTPAAMDAQAAFLQAYQPQNWLTFVTAPTYTEIYVSVAVKMLPGQTAAAVQAAVQAAVLAWLLPATWGNLQVASDSNVWTVTPVVRYKKAIEVAGSGFLGVDYVDTLTLGTSPSPVGTSDVNLGGPCGLPLASISTIVVTVE